jgi:hypothetical protein
MHLCCVNRNITMNAEISRKKKKECWNSNTFKWLGTDKKIIFQDKVHSTVVLVKIQHKMDNTYFP